MDDATRNLVDDVMAYAQREGLTDRGIAQAAVRMTLEAAHRPLVSPEQRESAHLELIPIVSEALQEWSQGCNQRQHQDGDFLMAVSESVIDAILARFTIPVLDVEKVAHEIVRHGAPEYIEGAYPAGPSGGWGWTCGCGELLKLEGGNVPAGVPVLAWRHSQHIAASLHTMTTDGTSSDTEKGEGRG